MARMRGPAVVPLVATLVAAATIAGSGSALSDAVLPYPAPAGQARSTAFAVAVRPPGGAWVDVDAYEVTVDRDTYSKAAMALFDTNGPVEVSVTVLSGTIRTARVRPLSYGITPTVSADRKSATFLLRRPEDVSFEVNGDILHNLHVFAGAVPDDRPRSGMRSMVFSAGRHPIPGDHVLRIASNTIVTIAGGAVVEGSIDVVGAHDVVIRGRGIVDPSPFFAPKSRPTIAVERSRAVGIRDITLLRAQDGAVAVTDSREVVVAGVRMITADASADGIDIVASRDVLVDDAFLRTSDDSVAVYGTTPWGGHGSSADVAVRNSTLWADVAHAFLSGTHGDPRGGDVIERVSLQNIDVLEHDEFRGGDLYQGALALNAGDRVTVRDVRFQDIRIEDFSRGQVVNLKVFRNRDFNTRAGLGVERVLFRDVDYAGTGDLPSRINGYTATRRVEDVTFENFRRNGVTVLQPEAGNIIVGPHTSRIVFRARPPTRTVDDGSPAIQYAGPWARRTAAGAQGGSVRVPLRAGSALRVRFEGSQARILGRTGPRAGRFDVFVDGEHASSVDAYSDVPRARQIWFDTGVLRRGKHVIELRYSASRNALSAGSAIAFDALELVS